MSPVPADAVRSAASEAARCHEWDRAVTLYESLGRSGATSARDLKDLRRVRKRAKASQRASQLLPEMNVDLGRSITGLDLRQYTGMTPVPGGRNSLFLRRYDFVDVAGRPVTVLLKVPGAFSRWRVEVNEREVYLHQKLFAKDNRFGPRLYRSERQGPFLFHYFCFETIADLDYADPQALQRLGETVGELARTPVSADQLRNDGIELHTFGDLDLAPKLARVIEYLPAGRRKSVERRLPSVENAYRDFVRQPGMLAHGDLNKGNMMCSSEGIRMLDWSRWGLLPAGADLGKYMIGWRWGDGEFFGRHVVGAFAARTGINADIIWFNARCFRAHVLANRMLRKKFQGARRSADELLAILAEIRYA